MSFCVAGAARGEPSERSVEVRRRFSPMGAGCFFVAGAALGAPQSHFAWQVQHSEHLSAILRGRCSARSTGFFCVAGETLGGPQFDFAWQVQHSERLSVTLRGRCSTRSTSREVGGSPATMEYYGHRLLLRGRCRTWRTSGAAFGAFSDRSGCFCVQVQHLEDLSFILRGRCSTWRTSVSFCVAGAALGAFHCNFAWQVQHSGHLQRGPRKFGDDGVLCAQVALAWQVQHLEDLSLICVAGAAFGGSPWGQKKFSPPNIRSFRSFLNHLTPSASFLLILFFLRCGLFFVLFR